MILLKMPFSTLLFIENKVYQILYICVYNGNKVNINFIPTLAPIMSITLKTHKLIWGRSGNMCAFPECKKELVIDETSTDDPSVIGQEAHIVAKKKGGPRGKHPLDMDKRDKYNNLILLCSVHHKIIDDQEIEYTVEKLHEYKKTHENWIKKNLSSDSQK